MLLRIRADKMRVMTRTWSRRGHVNSLDWIEVLDCQTLRSKLAVNKDSFLAAEYFYMLAQRDDFQLLTFKTGWINRPAGSKEGG